MTAIACVPAFCGMVLVCGESATADRVPKERNAFDYVYAHSTAIAWRKSSIFPGTLSCVLGTRCSSLMRSEGSNSIQRDPNITAKAMATC